MRKLLLPFVLVCCATAGTARGQATNSLGLDADIDVALAYAYLDAAIIQEGFIDATLTVEQLETLIEARDYAVLAYFEFWINGDIQAFYDFASSAVFKLIDTGLLNIDDLLFAYNNGLGLAGNDSNSNERVWIAIWLLYYAVAVDPLPVVIIIE